MTDYRIIGTATCPSCGLAADVVLIEPGEDPELLLEQARANAGCPECWAELEIVQAQPSKPGAAT